MANKVIRHLRDEQREFQKQLSTLSESKASWQKWSDFIELSAIAISNACDHESKDRESREARYMKIINSYPKKDQAIFPKLLAITATALESNPDQDFLGEMFMLQNFGDHWRGQFFTPYNVSRMMAEIQTPDAQETLDKRGWVGIHDCCCGAGSLLIAARNVFTRKKVGYHQALFVAQDIDYIVGLMCYIQLSLLGCAGYVVIADAFRYPLASHNGSPLLPHFRPEQDVWFTPMFYDEVWQMRIKWEYMTMLLQDSGDAKKTPSKDENAACAACAADQSAVAAILPPVMPYVEDKRGQLKLF